MYTYIPEDARIISESIKKKALGALGVKSKLDLIAQKQTFMKIMGETIVYHELGHVVVQNDILPKDIGPIAEGTKSLGYQVFLSAIELLADFAPSYNKLHGAVKQIQKVSVRDPRKATAMFYVYLSDVWFFDTQDDYMYLYSELVVLAMMRYIKRDQSIDFDKINFDIYFDKRKKTENKDINRFVNFLFSLLIRETRALHQVLKTSLFLLNDKYMPLTAVLSVIDIMFNLNKTNLKPDDYDYITSQYSYVFKLSEKVIQPSSVLKNCINESESKIRYALCKLYDKSIKPTVTAEESRKLIFKRMTELGFTLH